MSDHADTPADRLQWHAALVAEDLPPLRDPVAALVQADAKTWAWVPKSGRLRPLPHHGSGSDELTAFVQHGGRSALVESEGRLPDAETRLLERRFCEGIYRLDLSDLTTVRLPYEPRPGWEWRHALTTSPDGDRVVIAEQWRPDEFYEVSRQFTSASYLGRSRALAPIPTWVTVHLVNEHRGTSDTLLRSQASLPMSSEDSPVQWSPDGSMIAISLSTAVPGTWMTLVLDVSTGDIRWTIEDAQVLGSLAWSPSSARLLLDRRGHIVERDLASHEERPLRPLPGAGRSTRRPEPPGNGLHRVLGYADEQRVLSVTHRHTTMTLARVGLTDGTVEPLARWSGSTDMYPRLTPMPPGFWG
jgi:hypothetical protein